MKYSVCGGGGMLGAVFIRRLLAEGHEVRAVDVKPIGEWWEVHPDAENLVRDLQYETDCREAVRGCDRVINLAENMGGVSWITKERAICAVEGALIHANMIKASITEMVGRYWMASSACVYRQDLQQIPEVIALKESDAFPGDAEKGYGEIKLAAEQWCTYAREEWGLETRIGRYHNIASIPTTFTEPKSKAPAGLSRKVAEAKLTGRDWIGIWGDGEQTRSFCWADDCIEASLQVLESDFVAPINIGTAELVTINELVDAIESAAFGESGVLERRYDLSAPQGVRGRNSDNTLFRDTFGWEPSTKLADWMPTLYEWVEAQVYESLA